MVKITAEDEAFIERCIEIHQADTTGVLLGRVFEPPLRAPDNDVPWNHFLRSRVLIWDPMKCQPLTCPKHQLELKPSFWLGKQQRQPRLLYGLRGNVLLVARYYSCTPMKHCRYLSLDEAILAQLRTHHQAPNDSHGLSSQLTGNSDQPSNRPIISPLPFILFHRSGCTLELAERVFDWLAQGRTFTAISRMLQELNYEHFTERVTAMVQHGLNLSQDQLKDTVRNVLESYRSLDMFTAPSTTLLESLFLQEFRQRREGYTGSMRNTSAKSLYVFILKFENLWSSQYRNLVVILNECEQVVTWAFSRCHDYEALQPLFASLAARLARQGARVSAIHTDHCCDWRALLCAQFRDVMETDNMTGHVYHNPQRAIKVITRSLPLSGSTGVDRDSFESDLLRIFRCSDDHSEIQLKPSASVGKINENLDKFIQRWQTFGEAGLLSADCQAQLGTLRRHILNGCLSGLKVEDSHVWTSALIGLLQHRDDSVLSHAKHLGPDLFFAVLTVVFYQWNKVKASSKPISVPSKKPAKKSSHLEGTRVNTENSLELSKGNYVDIAMFFPEVQNSCNIPENFGFIGSDAMFTDICNGILTNFYMFLCSVNNIQDLLTTQLNRHVIQLTLGLEEILQHIVELITDSTIQFQPAHVQLHSTHFCLNTIKNSGEILSLHHTKLDKHLENMNLQRISISSGGDCLFSSVLRQLEAAILKWVEPEVAEFRTFVTSLGLNGTDHDKVLRLRTLFVEEMIRNKDQYEVQFMNHFPGRDFKAEISRFKKPLVFSEQITDLVISVLSSVLRCTILVVTSMQSVPIIPFVPSQPLTKRSLVIAFTQPSPGHFDSTISIPQTSHTENQAQEDNDGLAPCRCGTNKSKSELTRVSCAADQGSKYRTRCQCAKAGRDCTRCLCVNCGNEHNPAHARCEAHSRMRCRVCENSEQRPPAARRKRKRNHGHAALDVLLGAGRQGDGSEEWSGAECCLLEALLSLLNTTRLHPSYEHVATLFNFICNDPATVGLGLNIKAKSPKIVQSKLTQRSTNLVSSLTDASLTVRTSRANFAGSTSNTTSTTQSTAYPAQDTALSLLTHKSHVTNHMTVPSHVTTQMLTSSNSTMPGLSGQEASSVIDENKAHEAHHINNDSRPIPSFTSQFQYVPFAAQYNPAQFYAPPQVMNLTQGTPVMCDVTEPHGGASDHVTSGPAYQISRYASTLYVSQSGNQSHTNPANH